jgi:hypothetical protein
MLLREIYQNCNEEKALELRVSRETWVEGKYSYAKVDCINDVLTFVYSSGAPLHWLNLIADDWFILPPEKEQEKEPEKVQEKEPEKVQEKENLDALNEFLDGYAKSLEMCLNSIDKLINDL